MAWEAALLFGLYALWQFAGSFAVMGTSGAVPGPRWLWRAERVLRLPVSPPYGRTVLLSHPLLVQACNLYYDILHFPALGICLVALRPPPRGLPADQDHRGPVHRDRRSIQLIPVARRGCCR